jgi:hypothetical protein
MNVEVVYWLAMVVAAKIAYLVRKVVEGKMCVNAAAVAACIEVWGRMPSGS